MEKAKNNLELILYLIVTIIVTIIMFWAIDKKEGFHEDEMFSYGASNSTLGNTFLSYGRIDNVDSIIKRRNPILTLKNYIYYKVINRDAYDKAVKELDRDDFKSVWRTKEDAIEYLQIDNFLEASDIVSVYWNTAKDVHPPLFYFAVHIVSILFWGHFSKYIIFIVNLIFFLATLWILRKIFILMNKKNLTIANLILYGASIGAISTVMFQRMYMMPQQQLSKTTSSNPTLDGFHWAPMHSANICSHSLPSNDMDCFVAIIYTIFLARVSMNFGGKSLSEKGATALFTVLNLGPISDMAHTSAFSSAEIL